MTSRADNKSRTFDVIMEDSTNDTEVLTFALARYLLPREARIGAETAVQISKKSHEKS